MKPRLKLRLKPETTRAYKVKELLARSNFSLPSPDIQPKVLGASKAGKGSYISESITELISRALVEPA